MTELNLPKCDLKITTKDGVEKVFDFVRKKYVVLTSEEWVRQHFIHLMVHHLRYPRSLIRLEQSLSYHRSGKRSDIVLMDTQANPFLLVECKSPEIKISKSVLKQASLYNKVLKAPYLSVTNGLQHFIWKLDNEKYHSQDQFPVYPQGL